MTQSICGSLSSARSRLVRMTETASMAMTFLPKDERPHPRIGRSGRGRTALLGEMPRTEGLRKHLGERQDSGRGLQEQFGAAELEQELPAAAARDEDLALSVDAGEVRQPAAAGGVELGYETALGA